MGAAGSKKKTRPAAQGKASSAPKLRRVGDGPRNASVAEAAAVVLAPVVSDEAIAQVAERIGRIGRQATLALHYHIGEVIADVLFQGGPEGHVDQASSSLRRLAARLTEDGFSTNYATLSRAVAIYRLLEPLGGVTAWQHIGPTHVRVLLSLPDPQRTEMLRRAEEEKLSVRDLTEAAARETATEPEPGKRRRGRPPTVRIALRLSQAERVLFADDALASLDDCGRLSSDQLEEVGETVLRLREQLEKIHRKLAPLLARPR